ncbi:hypothetical protein [Saccharopolyspora sp. NPDC050642]|uniref:hypothetical protein n=1 Tax=Saccharopolyspora sp. NPDC050642 TaxID=3157099 RepID=UPI0033CEABDD
MKLRIFLSLHVPDRPPPSRFGHHARARATRYDVPAYIFVVLTANFIGATLVEGH